MALTDGLVSYWRYDNNLNDSSWNGNNLTNGGTMSYITCKDNLLANGALSLDSTPTYTTSSSANFQLSDISYSTWVKITLNRAGGTLPNGTYTYQTQYFNRFSKWNLSPEKSIVSINNSINTINLTDILNWKPFSLDIGMKIKLYL